jgi:hypothetical protein
MSDRQLLFKLRQLALGLANDVAGAFGAQELNVFLAHHAAVQKTSELCTDVRNYEICYLASNCSFKREPLSS